MPALVKPVAGTDTGSMKLPRTIFNTAWLQPPLRAFARWFFRVKGWRIEGELPPEAQRCVLIAAPHTSNWDLPYMLMAAFALRMDVHWMGKASIFKFPWGPLMRWLGGIAVQRGAQKGKQVEMAVQAVLAAEGPLQLVIAPEGTRSRVREWKTGFYRIAQGAQLPILPSYLDFGGRRVGLGPLFWPTGDAEADIARLRAFYAPYKGLREDLFETH